MPKSLNGPGIFYLTLSYVTIFKPHVNFCFQEADVQADDIYDDPQEAEVIQSLLDVVDEEAQNLLNQNSAPEDACLPGR